MLNASHLLYNTSATRMFWRERRGCFEGRGRGCFEGRGERMFWGEERGCFEGRGERMFWGEGRGCFEGRTSGAKVEHKGYEWRRRATFSLNRFALFYTRCQVRVFFFNVLSRVFVLYPLSGGSRLGIWGFIPSQ